MGLDGAFLQRESVTHSNKTSDQLLRAPLIKPIEPIEPIEAGHLLSDLMGWAKTAKTGVKNNSAPSDNTENHITESYNIERYNAESYDAESYNAESYNAEIQTTRYCHPNNR